MLDPVKCSYRGTCRDQGDKCLECKNRYRSRFQAIAESDKIDVTVSAEVELNGDGDLIVTFDPGEVIERISGGAKDGKYVQKIILELPEESTVLMFGHPVKLAAKGK